MELFPEYPLVRLVLPARHGVHFFPDAVVHDGYMAKKIRETFFCESLELQDRYPKQSGLITLSSQRPRHRGGFRVFYCATISFIAAIAPAESGPIPLAFVYHIPFSVAGR